MSYRKKAMIYTALFFAGICLIVWSFATPGEQLYAAFAGGFLAVWFGKRITML